MNLPRVCVTKWCRNRIRKQDEHLQCPKCRVRTWRAKNPIRAKWLDLKSSARKRGKTFNLYPFERFRLWAEGNNYLSNKKNSVDRIDTTCGYEWGNIQVLTISENVAKRNREYAPSAVAAQREEEPF